ncbi:hypothetical protein EOE18_17385 [Novosphingobium umbonatum]|uniref:TonB-dependent receptor n=1 Tax=Novosphingobium umbonatum TaxID=1908524 RepID=A0A437MXD9_9SPHN|nr:TonB-dependent receptor [Novosphingobium umbonatum]RVU02286.1 hypothetical protein EOE18_17385 [Novosphingobium umbonatum]
MIDTRIFLFAGTAMMAGAIPGAAWAQAAPKGSGLQEIIVTAQRTESAAQKTPIALTIYTGSDLANQGVNNVAALAAVDPSVNFTSNNGTAYVAIRGIASTDTTEIGDPSVPVARDGFFTNRPYSLQLGMYDLARVEVLKGPQGTLNGRNSTGGLVSIITNRPGKTIGGYGSAEVGNFGAFNGEMGVNLAFSDMVQARVSGVFRHHDSYRFRTGINQGGNDENGASIRAQLAVQPTTGLKLWGSYQHDGIDELGPVVFKAPIKTMPDFGNAHQFPGFTPVYNKVQADRFRWEMTYDQLPLDATLVYSGGYESLTYNHALDGTDPAFGYPATRQFRNSEMPKTWNHEVRISTPAERKFSIQGGYFNFREHSVIDNGIINLDCVGAFAPGGPLNNLCQAGVYGIHFNFDVVSKSQAAFGQAALRLTDQLRLSAGARYTWDDKVRTGTNMTFLKALASPFIGAPASITSGDGTLHDQQPSYHLGLDYTPGAGTMVYAKFDTGYKSGGFNTATTGVTTYQPEKVKTFEIGTKNRFAGNTLQFNASAFYTIYTNYQANQIANNLLQVFNTGGARIYGAEAQFTALVSQATRIDLNAAWLHTAFDNGITVSEGSNTNNAVNRNIGGNMLPNAPSFVLGGAVEQSFALGSGKVKMRVDGKYSSKFYYTVFNDADTRSGAYFLGNASMTYAPDNGVWQVQLFIRNLTDKVVLSRAIRNFNSNTNEYEFQAPRTFGLRGGFKF